MATKGCRSFGASSVLKLMPEAVEKYRTPQITWRGIPKAAKEKERGQEIIHSSTEFKNESEVLAPKVEEQVAQK